MAKVVGSLAAKRPMQNDKISGVLVKRNFNYHIMAASDLPSYTDLAMSTVTQRLSVSYEGTLLQLQYYFNQLSGDVEKLADRQGVCIFKTVTVTMEPHMVIIEWMANPVNDMYADAVLAVVLKAESETVPARLPPAVNVDKSHFSECLIELLVDMFGQSCVNPLIRGEKLTMNVDDTVITIDLRSQEVVCADDLLQQMVSTAVTKLHQAVTPVKV